MRKRFFLITTAVIVLIPLLVWGGSLLKCEILTAKYYDDFKTAHLRNTMLREELEYFKVLRCDGDTAEVYYVGKGMTGGNVLTFEKQAGVWVETYWETIWSDGGSASDVIYPYWWHFIYGGI